MYLLDTEVVFELRNAKSGAPSGSGAAGLTAWATGVQRASLFISALTLLELESGAARVERTEKAAGTALRHWLDAQVWPAFESRILPVDAAIVRRRAHLALTATRDALLAATALEHGLTLVTRDTAAFKAARVKLLNPWDYTPQASDDEDWGEAAKSSSLWLRNIFVRG